MMADKKKVENKNPESPNPHFINLIDLASERIGGQALIASDEFFAPKENLLKEGRGVFIADKYTENGKWMDGWESRRKRTSGNDWCIVKLGARGVIRGLDIDTNHFLGNHPPHCSVDACNLKEENINKARWEEILPKSHLNPGSQHFFEIKQEQTFTHVRLNIFPDGGVARLRVYGEIKKDWGVINKNEILDLASVLNGGKAILCNDMFFSHMDNLIMPHKSKFMGDGWETKRNRTPNNKDWVVVRLGHKGVVDSVLIDTNHFKGNYPDTFLLEGGHSNYDKLENISWETIIDRSKLEAHKEHYYDKEIKNNGPFTHVKLTIFPDGGISRMRLWGSIV